MMRNTRYLLRLPLLFLTITGSAIAAAGSSHAVDLTYKPAVGSKWAGTTEVRETKTKAGKTVESSVTREKGEYRFQRKLEKGWQLSYTLTDGSIEGTNPMMKLIAPLMDSLKGETFTLETNEEGVPERVHNVAKVKAAVVKALDLAVQTQPEIASSPQMKQVLVGLRAQYNGATPETSVPLFCDKLLHYTLLQGLPDIPVGEERTYDGQVQNPLSGAVMRTQGFFKVASVDQAAGIATLEWRQVVSPEDLNTSTRDLVKRMVPNAAQGSKEFTDALAQVKIDLTDKATYKVGIADGVVRRMVKTTVVKAGDTAKTTVVTMTMQPAK